MFVCAPAKINLVLDVLDLRADGYHEVRSVMQTIDLCDRLEISVGGRAGSVEIELLGDELGDVPRDTENVAVRAALAVLSEAKADLGLHMVLEKRIPTRAGLGGGSSDAAATLSAVNRLLGSPLAPTTLAVLAEGLGADVAFFLTGGRCLVEGIGERVTAIPDGPSRPLVVVKPQVGVSTAAAYADLDRARGRSGSEQRGDWNGRTLSNDFQSVVAASHAEVRNALSALTQAGCAQTLLCGSGSAVFGMADERLDQARAGSEIAGIAERLSRADVGAVIVARTVGRAELSGL